MEVLISECNILSVLDKEGMVAFTGTVHESKRTHYKHKRPKHKLL
jgi:hypothetical protein